MRRQQLIESPNPAYGTHVVLLGAGASLAAFPNGDRSSNPLPLMNNLVMTLKLDSLLERAGVLDHGNFESIYTNLEANPQYEEIREEVDRRVLNYFSLLALPEKATIYDQLLLSLRRKDAVFTFNWDPFLFDAHKRNHSVAELPQIFFLHGNVRIGVCLSHTDRWGGKGLSCPDCGVRFNDVPLLYPVEKKGYSSNPYLSQSWEEARRFFKEALMITIFGYSAPDSDRDAVDILMNAWFERSDRTMEHVEVIDVAPTEDLQARWSKFTPTHHLHSVREYRESFVGKWPRRSTERLYLTMSEGIPFEKFPLDDTDDLVELQEQVRKIAEWESADHLRKR